MFTLLQLLHGGAVHERPELRSMLKESRYLFIPTVNVDGAAFIESEFIKTG
jgi:hypothetical protein